MQDKKQIISSIIVVVAVVALIWGFAAYNEKSSNGETGAVTVADFAKCVAGKGLTMYGAAWCGHCANEKKAFGDSFKLINYVECPENIQLCTDKGINGYPTWIDGAGVKHEGEQGFVGLAKISGCELPK